MCAVWTIFLLFDNFCGFPIKFVLLHRVIMAKDKFHDNVREALLKEGWIITAEQKHFDLGEVARSKCHRL